MKAELSLDDVVYEAFEEIASDAVKHFQITTAKNVVMLIGEENDIIIWPSKDSSEINVQLWGDGPRLTADMRKTLLDAFTDFDPEEIDRIENLLKTLKDVVAEAEDKVASAIAKSKNL